MIGSRFAGRFRVDRMVGRGRMGTVYEAFDERTKQPVALKALTEDSEASPAALERFRRELRLAQRVSHPNVARILELGEHGAQHFLVMELVDGDNLRETLRHQGPLAAEVAVDLARQICSGLATAHGAGVLHLDLKPENVLIDGRGRAVITDFSVAVLENEVSERGVAGTPRYMAPEQMRGGALDARTDLYSVGHLLYEMLRGTAVDRQWRNRPPDLPAAVRNDLEGAGAPTQLAALTGQLLEYDPALRPPSAAAVLAVLAGAADSAGGAIACAPPSSAAAIDPKLAGSILAVLPFRGSGPPDAQPWALVMGDELAGAMAYARGLNVITHRDARTPGLVADPVQSGAQLGADYVVDGSVSLCQPGPSGAVDAAAAGLCIQVQVMDVCGGIQLYRERFEGDLSHLFSWRCHMARRIADALQVELSLPSSQASTQAGAVAAYLQGRCQLRGRTAMGRASGLDHLKRAQRLAPELSWAVSAHALACVQAWLEAGDGGRSAEQAAGSSVRRAREAAGEHAETHLASGMLRSQRGQYRRAALDLARVVSMAPAHVLAHESLGLLECETGRADRGARRIQFAVRLDPDLTRGRVAVARHHILYGETERGSDILAELELRSGRAHPFALFLRMRFAAWRRRWGEVDACRRLISVEQAPSMFALDAFGRFLSGELTRATYLERLDRAYGESNNARLRTLVWQLAAEALGLRGHADESLVAARRASVLGLADVDWVDRCPALTAPRQLAGWPELRAGVRSRAEAIWN